MQRAFRISEHARADRNAHKMKIKQIQKVDTIQEKAEAILINRL